jgi:ribose-phosphate pyrophosphokinase
MRPLSLLSGTANRPLAEAVASALGLPLSPATVSQYPDGEIRVELGPPVDVRDRDVYLVQPTHAPVGEHLLELMLLADAARRSGAARITAVMPYVGFARQDRRVAAGEPVGARVMADLLGSGALDRLVAMDLHSRALEGCFRFPVEHVSALDAMIDELRPDGGVKRVVVSPDLGAVKLAERYAASLGVPVAIVHKQRLSSSEVSAHAVIGEVRGVSPIVVDDMISTGGTVAAAIEALLAAGCSPDVTVAVTHSFLVGPAVERLRKLPLKRLLTTDALPVAEGLPLPLEKVSVAPILADAIRRLAGH